MTATPAAPARLSPQATVNDTIRRFPLTVAVFNAHGIDACCGGAASLADAAERDGADLPRLLAELASVAKADA